MGSGERHSRSVAKAVKDRMPAQPSDRPEPGWERISPGVYLDPDKQMHLFPQEFLAAAGYSDTPENHETVIKAFVEEFKKHYPSVPIYEIES